MTEMRYYNGFTEAEMANAYGLQKLGIEKCKPFFTRGVLVDVAGLKGRMLNLGEEITVADVQAALQRQGIAESSIQPGDGVFFNTGWSSLWMKDNAKFNEGEPGIGMDVARWCVAKQLALVGADTWPPRSCRTRIRISPSSSTTSSSRRTGSSTTRTWTSPS
jgi:kynurenine formamidase